jgi:WS/DGAT/MGAT family acyltransferase
MKHLSGMDASFLHLETPEMPMHVGGLNVLALPDGYEGDIWEDIKAHIARRMHLAPVFTRKLALMPFELANPVWVDDDDIDLDYHVRRVVLPRPGTRAQLQAHVGRLHSSLLDRSRPLWECYVIEGLRAEEHGGHVAFYTKSHHAGMDGAAGAVLAAAILDLTAEPRRVQPPPARRITHDYQLGMAELAGAALKNTAVQMWKLLKLLPEVARVTARVAVPPKAADGKRPAGLWQGLKRLRLAPRTAFNVAITNQRAFAGVSLPLADAKWVAKQTGATINDVVMALCSGALRNYLEQRGGMPQKSLSAAVPVSLREAGNTDMNNQATVMLVSLASDVADPLQRLQRIHDSSVDSKALTGQLKAAIPMDYPSFGAPWLIAGLVSMIGRTRIVNALPPVCNLVISNVPGPQTPLYLAGARLVTNYPLSIPAHGMALNLTVQSYNGALDFGITACRRAVPDVNDLGDLLGEALRELKAAVLAQTDAAGAFTSTQAGAAAGNKAAALPAKKVARKAAGRQPAVRETALAEPAAPKRAAPKRAVRKPSARSQVVAHVS